MSRYFVKNGKIHSYPVPMDCGVEYNGEKLYDYITDIPVSNEMCNECSFYLGYIFIESINQLTEDSRDCWSDSVGGIRREEIKRTEE